MRLRLFLAVLSLPLLAGCSWGSSSADETPSASGGMAQLGQRMQAKGDIGAAIDFYRRALQGEPRNYAALKGLSAVLEQWGDKEGAASVYAQAVEAYPKDGGLHRDYGKVLLALDRPADAQKQFEDAIDLNARDSKAHSGLGIAADYLGDHRRAQKEYELVLDREPENIAALNNLAYSYILMHRYDQAIQKLEPVYTKPNATAALRQNLALAYGLMGRYDEAMRIAAMDLPPEKAQKNLDYYHRKRAEITVDSAPYAELGSYATEGLAVAQIHRLQDQLGKNAKGLRPVVLPELSAPGGTPRFTVRMIGCSRPSDVSRLCSTLAKSSIPCVARGKAADAE